MKLNFCTLFNSNYLSRGLVMYQSLKDTCTDFHLYVFAFDDVTYAYLKQANLPNLTPISLKEFEDNELLKVKPTRTMAEYCWTCTASTILYSITSFALTNCTYIDADIYFYANPSVLVNEMGGNSVLITEHRYTPQYDQSNKSGKYCVQFVTFKSTAEGLKVLNDWRNDCINWCYARHENGKFGDQKYLDYWTAKYTGVHELQHLGGGVAPWNLQQYKFSINNNKIVLTATTQKNKIPLVFFHFHGLRFYNNNIVLLSDTGYKIDKFVIKSIYFPYVKKLNKIKAEILKQGVLFNPNGLNENAPMPPLNFTVIKQYYIALLKSSKKNLFGFNLINKIKQHYFYYTNKL